MEPILQELQAAAAAAADPHQHAAARSAADKAPKLSKEEVRAMRQQADPNFGKRKKEQQQQQQGAAAGSGGDMPPPPAKKPRTAGTGANAQEAGAPAAGGQQAEAAGAAAAQAAPQQQEQEQQPAAGEAAAGAAAAAPAEQQAEEGGHAGEGAAQQPRLQGAWRQQRHTAPNTAFVKHLADEVDEDALKQLFAGCPGGVASVELGRDKQTGRSRVRLGGANEGSQCAGGRGVPAAGAVLAQACAAACRRRRCGSCSPSAQRARSPLPTLHCLSSRRRLQGFAYVHFTTAEGLEAACRLDRSDFHGKHIFVAPSRPPAGGGGRGGGRSGGRDGGGRGREGGGGRGGREGGGGRGREGGAGRFGGRDGGRSRGGRGGRGGPKHHTLIDLGEGQPAGGGAGGAPPRGFVPRAAALGGKQGGEQGAGGGAPAGDEAPKSNADFRAMFLKK